MRARSVATRRTPEKNVKADDDDDAGMHVEAFYRRRPRWMFSSPTAYDAKLNDGYFTISMDRVVVSCADVSYK